MEPRRNWTREELIMAFNLYCKLPFGKLDRRNPQVQELARLIGRTENAVAWKLVNFASFDPELKKRGIAGAKNTSKQDEEIFNEFYNDWSKLAYESELLLETRRENQQQTETSQEAQEIRTDISGKEREARVKVRVNQSFFRTAVLTSYDNRCCITGLPIEKLLVASHIIPWATNEQHRLNPQNGLCLNNIHDRAFDQGLITIDENYRIVLSAALTKYKTEESIAHFFLPYEGQQIILPHRFQPKQEFLEFHRQNIFKTA